MSGRRRRQKFTLGGAAVLSAVAVVLSAALSGGSGSAAEQSTNAGDWATWQNDIVGSRYAVDEHLINTNDVKNLKLKRAFAHPPLVYKGRVHVGVSSLENGQGQDYPCCTFRGHVDSVDTGTGQVMWRYYTVPVAHEDGTWPSGAAKFEPSGVGAWSSPVIDPAIGTLYAGTGQNYSGTGGDLDSLLALDARPDAVRWKAQVTPADRWRQLCWSPNPGDYCPGPTHGIANDGDLGATPNIFRVGDRTLVGIGQKTGVYHVFDALTGQVVWSDQLGVPQLNGMAARSPGPVAARSSPTEWCSCNRATTPSI